MKDEIKRELKKIKKQHGGLLRARDVVNYARDSKTALHNCFEWDDKIAGEAYRIHQARRIINVHVEMMPNATEPMKVFVSLKKDRCKPGGGYREMKRIIKVKPWREALFEQALDELISIKKRYKQIREIVIAVEPAIDAIIKAKKQERKVG